MSYHLHWSYSEVMGMPVAERREFIRLLSDEIARQNQAIESARRRGGH